MYGRGSGSGEEGPLISIMREEGGDFTWEWESGFCGPFGNVVHVGVGCGHVSEVHVTGSNSHPFSIHPRHCGVPQVWDTWSGDLKPRKRFHWILKKITRFWWTKWLCGFQGPLGAGYYVWWWNLGGEAVTSKGERLLKESRWLKVSAYSHLSLHPGLFLSCQRIQESFIAPPLQSQQGHNFLFLYLLPWQIAAPAPTSKGLQRSRKTCNLKLWKSEYNERNGFVLLKTISRQRCPKVHRAVPCLLERTWALELGHSCPSSVTLKKITGGQSWKKLLSCCQPPDLMKKEMEA